MSKLKTMLPEAIDNATLDTISGGRVIWFGPLRGQRLPGLFPRLNGSFAAAAGGGGGGQAAAAAPQAQGQGQGQG